MAEKLVECLSETQKAEVAERVLPGIFIFLDKLLSKEHISDELEALRERYVALLQCTTTESPLVVRKNVESLADSLSLKYEASNKTGKFGRIREKRLINIRQFQFKQNQRKQDRKNKMESNDDNRLVAHIDDESRLIPKSGKKSKTSVKDIGNAGQVNLATDDESRYQSTTDDERRLSMGGESFVELSKSQSDLTSQKYSKLLESNINKGYLYYKESDGLRQRWLVVDGSVLKCHKRQNQSLLFEVNFSEGGYSAIQGRIGKMFAIRLSGTKASCSHLFASPKSETVASWMMSFSRAGVRLQDEILREVSMNQQNNNSKVKWSVDDETPVEKDEFRSELLEALEFIERSRNPCILPKRSSYSFKELDVLKKLKSSLVAKKAECKLNRRKTWSAGSFPITNLAMLERFRKPISGSDGAAIDAKKQEDDIIKELASKSLPEILTSSGVIAVTKDDEKKETSVEHADQSAPSEEELCYAKSMPEGLNKQTESDVIDLASQSPRGSVTAQSVPDLLIHPGQESSYQSSSPKMERQMKPSISLTRVMSMKATLMKNAIMSGWKRRGRRGSGVIALDPELSNIHGCLFRKKGLHWKLRWCSVSDEVFFVFRDSQYSQEDFRCSLRKCQVMTNPQEPGQAYSFKLVRRKGEEILLAAEDASELERWLIALRKETSKCHLSEDNESRSSSLTVSLFGSDTVGDSSAADDTPPEKRNSNYCETTDKDSSDEQSTISSVSTKVKSRGIHERGYVYYLVKQDTWEHCWMEVSFGVLSIYKNETKETALQRDHVALCDIKRDSTNAQRPYSFVLKKPGRHPLYFAVDSEHDFLKWQKCFNSWTKRPISDDKTELRENTTGLKRDDYIPSRNENFLTIPICETPVTSDSDCCGEGHVLKISELAERPKIRRSMTDVLSQITPKLKRRSHSSVGAAHENDKDVRKNAVKSSFLYYKANSGLWVKYWCVLDRAVIYCFNSPEDGIASFSVQIEGCEVRRTSCRSKNFTFDVFHRGADTHNEFASDSTYLMYAWMRVLKIAAGLAGTKISNSDEQPASKNEDTLTGRDTSVEMKTDEKLEDEIFESKGNGQDVCSAPENVTTSRTSLSAPTSPKRKAKITSLDEVLKLLHEKRLQQELLNKQLSKSERARIRWQHSMLMVMRKKRSMRAQSSSENLKSSGSFGSDSGNGAPSPELDEKAAKLKYHEISAKYDGLLDEQRLKMLRRETLLKKRRNSLILRQDILKKKLNKDVGKGTIKKRQSKSDAKEMSASFTKGESEEAIKQLAEINVELEGIKQDIASNHDEQRRISDDLNEQKRKELHELRVSADLSPQTSKSSLHESKSLHRRQVSDSSLAESYRKMTINDSTLKLPLTQTMSTPTGDLRAKAKSFSSPSFPKAKSSPLIRTRTCDSTDGLKKPKVKSRSSQEALSLALSQIEDFEAFVQDSYRNCGADIGC